MQKTKRNAHFHMVFIALMTAVISVISPFSFPLPFSPVPLSLTTFIIYISLYALGAKYTFYSCLLYLLLGLIGMPVFSGFSGGIGKLLGPTGGYLVGYLFIPLIAGLFFKDKKVTGLSCCLGLIFGTACCYLLGGLWMAFQTKLSLSAVFFSGVVPFLPGDLCKIILALLVGPIIRIRLQKTNII